jgi:hypothetical protein
MERAHYETGIINKRELYLDGYIFDTESSYRQTVNLKSENFVRQEQTTYSEHPTCIRSVALAIKTYFSVYKLGLLTAMTSVITHFRYFTTNAQYLQASYSSYSSNTKRNSKRKSRRRPKAVLIYKANKISVIDMSYLQKA